MDDHEHGHDQGHHAEPPHDPAPPEPRQIVPPRPLLLRGIALAAAGVVMAWLAFAAANKSLLLAPLTLVLGLGGLLSAWAAAVQLTGGVKHDDHPFL